MDYLFKIYYKFKNDYEQIYKERCNFCTTLKPEFKISPYKSNEEFQLYYLYNQKTDNLIEKIRKNDNVLKNIEVNLPQIAKKTFLIDIIASELESTNTLEGVKTKKEELVDSTRKIVNNEKLDTNFRLSSMIKSYFLLLDSYEPINLPSDSKDIRMIYDKITDGEISKNDIPDGVYFRKEDVFVQKHNSLNGQIIHQGISGEKKIEFAISDILNFLHDDSINTVIKVAIAHYYFAYIHPFYDGNGRLGRFISSMFLNSSYSYLTSMSLSRGAYINKTNYYKAFSNTNSLINRGELNYFVDEFLQILITGQEDILENLKEKVEKLNYAEKIIKNDFKFANTSLKKSLLFILCQSYYFDNNAGLERDTLIQYLSENEATLKIKRELNELEANNVIIRVKKRPVVYALNNEMLNDNGYYTDI